MYKSKILFCITGSIAAYKSAYLISKLVQNGFEVKIAATESALKFIGRATLEGLSGNSVSTDSFEEGQMMSHINLIKWSDLTIICPASANTINKLSAGIADNLVTSLFLAHEWDKPFLVAPAMNTNMYKHPSTKNSLQKLKSWGVNVLPTAEGYLACGDTGKGKLIEPDEIYVKILSSIGFKNASHKKLKVLVTAGATKENIDGVRYISNLSTGKTGRSLADYFSRRGHEVFYLHSSEINSSSIAANNISFVDFRNLDEKLFNILKTDEIDLIIHNAAVSDYKFSFAQFGEQKFQAPINTKLDSTEDSISLHFNRNFKIIDRIREYSKNKKIFIVGFKFTNTLQLEERNSAVKKLFDSSEIDLVVQNDQHDRTIDEVQQKFAVYDPHSVITNCQNVMDLAEFLEKRILANKN